MAEKREYNRRDFLKIVGAGTGIAAAGCASELPEKLIPYVIQPDEVIPGVSAWYAGTCGECEAGCGVMVRTREGRALKVEGNPAHPINKGGVCAIGQSAVQGLYDPDRVREPLRRQANGSFKPVSWEEALGAVAEAVAATAKAGKQTALITNPVSGSEAALVSDFAGAVSGVTHYQYSLFSRYALETAAEQVFGVGNRTRFDFSQARLIVNFGADFLETWVSPVEFTKGFSSRRAPDAHGKMSRFIHFEPRLSLTAASADHWYRTSPGVESAILLALLVEVASRLEGKQVSSAQSSALAQVRSVIAGQDVQQVITASGISRKQLEQTADELVAASTSLVVAGGSAASGAQAVRCAVLANLLNAVLGNVGKTLKVYASGPKPSAGYSELLKLSEQLNSDAGKGSVGVALIADTNPVFTLPAAAKFSAALAKVGLVVCFAKNLDETAELAHIVLPLSSSFETWGDSEPAPGVFNLSQPAMSPLYRTQSFGDSLISLAANDSLAPMFGTSSPLAGVGSFVAYIKSQWKKRTGESGFAERWLTYVEKGGDWSQPATQVSGQLAATASKLPDGGEAPKGDFVLLAFPSVHFGDGAAANRPWMQEIPDPLTTAVWGSWIELHPDSAEELGLEAGKVVQLRSKDGAIEAPLYINKHLDRRTVGVPIGQGHTSFGRYSRGIGANPLVLTAASGSSQGFVVDGVLLSRSIAREELVTTQGHDSQLKRGFARSVALSELASSNGHGNGHGDDHGGGHHNALALGPREEPKQMYHQMEHVQYKWGMSVDLSSCTGCSACVTACYAENNIAVVGKEYCSEGREMSWLKVSRFFDGPEHRPIEAFQPSMCQHCGNAPCEPVCPVYATYHSDEGLNTMVYNRCVGTRYCSNNCSYKVRRFNWFNYEWPEPLNWQLNPDVTTRSVGVMEKCSFCIQRIREGENTAKNDGREVRDGEIQPACAQSCPADAIKFGNLLDKQSKVYAYSQSKRGYKILDFELNTQPAVTYLAKVVNEGPTGSSASEKKDHG